MYFCYTKDNTKTYLFWAARQCQTLAHQSASINIEISKAENTFIILWQDDSKLFQLRFNFNKFA